MKIWLKYIFQFQLATRITTFFIEHFGRRDLFGRENYEYYARLTGRILKVEDEWMFFTYPPAIMSESTKEGVGPPGCTLKPSSSNEEVDRLAPSTPVSASVKEKSGSLEIIPENCSLDPSGRLSISLDDKNVSSPSSCGSPNQPFRHAQTLSMPGSASRGHEIKSYSCLPQVILVILMSFWCCMSSKNFGCFESEQLHAGAPQPTRLILHVFICNFLALFCMYFSFFLHVSLILVGHPPPAQFCYSETWRS